VSSGPLEDPSGHATGVLKDAINYQGSSVAFIQMIAAMDRDGEIEREIRGKRTYRIAAAARVAAEARAALPAAWAAGAQPAAAGTANGAVPVAIDYDRLAQAIVGELLRVLATTVGAKAAPEPAADAAAESISAEQERLIAERNEYALKLESARQKLDELLGALPDAPRAATKDAVFSDT
jgi:hypothetical protein